MNRSYLAECRIGNKPSPGLVQAQNKDAAGIPERLFASFMEGSTPLILSPIALIRSIDGIRILIRQNRAAVGIGGAWIPVIASVVV